MGRIGELGMSLLFVGCFPSPANGWCYGFLLLNELTNTLLLTPYDKDLYALSF